MKKRFYQFIGSALTACMLLSDLGTTAVYAAPETIIEESSIEETSIGETSVREAIIEEPSIEETIIEEPVTGDTVKEDAEGEWDWLDNINLKYSYFFIGYTRANIDVYLYNVLEDKLESVNFVMFATKDSTASWLTADTVLNAVPSGVITSANEAGTDGLHIFTLPDGDAKLDPDTDYSCRLMVEDDGVYHPLAEAQSFTTDAIPGVEASATAASYTAEVKAYFGSEDDDWDTKYEYSQLSPIMIYTDDTTKDLFNGKDVTASIDDYQQAEAVMKMDFKKGDDGTKERVYAHFDLSDTGALKPGTEYRYRIALPDQGRYLFVSDVKSFTTLAGVSESAVSIGELTTTDYGYEAQTIRFRIVNPNNELIVEKKIVDGEGKDIPDVDIWEADEDEDSDEAGEDAGQLYEATVPSSLGVTIRLVVYTGAEATKTNIDRALTEDEIQKRSIEGRTVTASFNQLLTGIETDFTVKPVYEVDDYLVTLYYKKPTEDSYWEVYQSVENNEHVTFSVRELVPDQDYRYYLTLTSPFRPGEIIYHNGSAEEPLTMHTGAVVAYTRDDFTDKALYDELKAREYEITNVSLANCDSLIIEGIKGTTPIRSLEDIPEKMPFLNELTIVGHDITDISPLLSMKELTDVDMRGNDIRSLPLLSGVKWDYLNLSGNYLMSDEVFTKAGYHGEISVSDPREKEAKALKTVYIDATGKYPLVLRYDGKCDSRRYSFTVSMGDVSKTYNSDDEGVYYIADHSYGAFVVPDIKNDFSLEPGKDYSFRIVVKDAYHTEALSDRTYTMRFETPQYEPGDEYFTPGMTSPYLEQTLSPDTFNEGESPYRAEIRKGERVYFVSDELWKQSGNICDDVLWDLLRWTSYRLKSDRVLLYNATTVSGSYSRIFYPPAGDYDVYYYDESGKQLLKVEGKIHITADPVVVASNVPVYGYGNNDKYLYVEVYGQNLSASNAPVIADGTETFTEVISVRQYERRNNYGDEDDGYFGYNRYVFKLKKKDNWNKILAADYSRKYSILIDGKKVTDLRSEETKETHAGALQGYLPSGISISSAQYNWKKDVFEFGFDAPIPEGSLISAGIGIWDDIGGTVKVQANGSGRIDENGILRMRFYDADGTKYVPVDGKWVYVRFYMDGKAFTSYPEEFQIRFYNYYTGAIYGSSENVKYMNSTLETCYYREGAVSINLLCTGPEQAHLTDEIYVEVVKEDWKYDEDMIEERYESTVIAETKLDKAAKDKDGNDVFKKDKWAPKVPKGQYTLRYYEKRNDSKYSFSSRQIYVAGEGFTVISDRAVYVNKGKEANLLIAAPYMAKENVEKKDIPAFVESNKLALKVYDKQRKPVSAESTVNLIKNDGTIGWEIKGLDPEAEGYYFAVTADGRAPVDIYGTKIYRRIVDWDEWGQPVYEEDSCGNWYDKDSNIDGYGLKEGYDGIIIDDEWGNEPYKLRFYRTGEAATLITEIKVRADGLKDNIYYLTEEDVTPLDPDVIYTCTITDSKEEVVGTLTGYFRSEPDHFRATSKKVQLRSIKILNAASLFVGETKQFSVEFVPSDASNKTVIWSSSNPEVATISNYGYVTALSEGQTTITLKSADTKVKAVTYVLQVMDENKSLYVEFVDKGPYVYSGQKITPAVAVYYGGEKLVDGLDYKVSFSNNLCASVTTKAKVKIAGITVNGKAEKEFTIQPRSIDDSSVKVVETIVESGKKATPTLYMGTYRLTAKDYTFDKNNKFTANGSLVVSGKGNFKGSRVVDVTVSKPLKFKIKNFKAIDRVYNGQDQKLTAKELEVADSTSGALLKEGTDYILSYQDDICSTGTKKVSIIGIGKYNTVITKSYKIKPVKTNAMSVDYPAEVTYHPGAITPKVTVIYNKTITNNLKEDVTLIPGVDYTLKFEKNTKVGTANIKVTFTGNYKGSQGVNKTFQIVKAPIDAKNVSIYSPDLAWVKEAKYVSTPYVTMDGAQLSRSDYSVSYSLNTADISKKKLTENDLGDDKVAVVNVTVEGNGNMTGKATTTYRVIYSPAGNDLANAKLTIRDRNGKKVSTLPYTGEEVEFKGDYSLEVVLNTVTLKEGVDYKIEYANNVNKGAAVAIVTGLGETSKEKTKYYGSRSLKFSIKNGTLSWH